MNFSEKVSAPYPSHASRAPLPEIKVKQFGADVADPWSSKDRLLCSFSCGAASAVATKLAIDRNAGRLPVLIVNFDTGSEHPDNERFRLECQEWFGHEVVTTKNPKYDDIWDVFSKGRWLNGVKGAKCTTVLKKQMSDKVESVHDLHALGFDSAERLRAERFWVNQPEVAAWFPLIDLGYDKARCFNELAKAGIRIPTMYLLGYRNNNCIGCVKGGAGYWNKIRVDFPEVFDRMARMERELNTKLLQVTIDGVRQRVFLDELDPAAGRYDTEPSISCGIVCQQPDLFEARAA